MSNPASHFDEDLVTRHVAVGVVHALEFIKVGQDEAEGLCFPAGTIHFPGESLQDGAVIQDPGERVLHRLLAKRLPGLDELVLEVDDPFGGSQAHLEFGKIQRLVQKIVHARIEPGQNIVRLGSPGDHDHVDVGRVGSPPDSLRQLQPVHLRHHPAQNDHVR